MKNLVLMYLMVQEFILMNKQNVKANQLLADWDPYTIPIIAEKEGLLKL